MTLFQKQTKGKKKEARMKTFYTSTSKVPKPQIEHNIIWDLQMFPESQWRVKMQYLTCLTSLADIVFYHGAICIKGPVHRESFFYLRSIS